MNSEIKDTLPDLIASGTMLSLHQAMTLDASKLAVIEQFFGTTFKGTNGSNPNAKDLLGEYVRFLKNSKQYESSFSLEEMKKAFVDSEVLSLGILLGAADNKIYGFGGNDNISFETATGMSWTQAVENNHNDVENITSQIWVKQVE